MREFKDLDIWKLGHKMTLKVYKVTSQFPEEEKYGLVSQMRRSSVSIPNNIAEGCGRSSRQELKRFCDIAMGSGSELEYLILLSKDLEYIEQDSYFSLTSELITLKKKINAFIKYLRTNPKSWSPKYPKD